MTNQNEATRGPRWPDSAGALLLHIEHAGTAGEWVVSTDPADPRDLCCRLRRTFRLAALADAECALVAEYGALFIVIGSTDMRLCDLHQPGAVERITDDQHCGPAERAFLQSVWALFPPEQFASAT